MGPVPHNGHCNCPNGLIVYVIVLASGAPSTHLFDIARASRCVGRGTLSLRRAGIPAQLPIWRGSAATETAD